MKAGGKVLREGNRAALHNGWAPGGSQSASAPNSVSAAAPRGGGSLQPSGEHGIDADTEGLELEQGAYVTFQLLVLRLWESN